jgi:hypothetical protein
VSATVAPHLANRLRAIKASRLVAEDRVALPPGEGPKLLALEARLLRLSLQPLCMGYEGPPAKDRAYGDLPAGCNLVIA